MVGGPGLYGNGDTTFEVAAFYMSLNKFVPMPDGENVSGWNNKEQVTKLINYLENL